MARATVELDFFRMEREAASHAHSLRTFRGIQNVISRINPELLKSVIGSTSTNYNSQNAYTVHHNNSILPLPPTPKATPNLFPPLPVHTPFFRPTAEISSEETSPMTIFYNGTVAVFDIPRDKAESVLRLVADRKVEVNPTIAIPSTDQQQLLAALEGDLPIARKKSLQRFLEKRKERLTTASPYF